MVKIIRYRNYDDRALFFIVDLIYGFNIAGYFFYIKYVRFGRICHKTCGCCFGLNKLELFELHDGLIEKMKVPFDRY